MFEFLITICTLGNPCVTLTDREGTRYPTHSACVREAQSRQVPILLQMLEQGYQLEHTQITCRAISWNTPRSPVTYPVPAQTHDRPQLNTRG